MYICIHVYMCIYICIYAYTYIRIYIFECMFTPYDYRAVPPYLAFVVPDFLDGDQPRSAESSVRGRRRASRRGAAQPPGRGKTNRDYWGPSRAIRGIFRIIGAYSSFEKCPGSFGEAHCRQNYIFPNPEVRPALGSL